MHKKIETADAPPAKGDFSQGIVAGDVIFTTGQISLRPDATLLTGTIEEETHQVMKNLGNILSAAGVSFRDVVKTTLYLVDLEVYDRVKKVYGEYVSDPAPARETIGVASLPQGAKIQISMVAIKQ
jgi:2-iminobutanoate/2-iminopropanoate deaminase